MNIDNFMEIEHLKWKQRAKLTWLQQGDSNTKYYHRCGSQRKKRNTIDRIMDDNRVRISNPSDIGNVFTQYYKSLFATSKPINIEASLNALDQKVTEEMNHNLLKPFTKAEVQNAVFHLSSYKAPGPNGYWTCFYQDYWHVVGDEVCEVVLSFLNSNDSIENINFTFLVMIPKINNPVKIIDYRPINLCNVIYKIITKMLANRLKLILP